MSGSLNSVITSLLTHHVDRAWTISFAILGKTFLFKNFATWRPGNKPMQSLSSSSIVLWLVYQVHQKQSFSFYCPFGRSLHIYYSSKLSFTLAKDCTSFKVMGSRNYVSPRKGGILLSPFTNQRTFSPLQIFVIFRWAFSTSPFLHPWHCILSRSLASSCLLIHPQFWQNWGLLPQFFGCTLQITQMYPTFKIQLLVKGVRVNMPPTKHSPITEHLNRSARRPWTAVDEATNVVKCSYDWTPSIKKNCSIF